MKEYLKSGDIKKCLANTPQVTFEVTNTMFAIIVVDARLPIKNKVAI